MNKEKVAADLQPSPLGESLKPPSAYSVSSL
jgi:hypothetical protein